MKEDGEGMKKCAPRPLLGKFLAALSGMLVSGAVWADVQLNLREVQSALTMNIYDLHTIINLVCMGIFIVVFGAMFYSIWKHHKSTESSAVHFHGSPAVEMVWAAIPFAILMFAAYPATMTNIEQHVADNIQIGEQKVAAVELKPAP